MNLTEMTLLVVPTALLAAKLGVLVLATTWALGGLVEPRGLLFAARRESRSVRASGAR